MSAAVNLGLIAVFVVPGYQIAGPSGVAVVVLMSLGGSLTILRGAIHRHGASLAFLGAPAIGVTLLVLLGIGPLGPTLLVVRVAGGATLMIAAAAWAWRIMRSGRPGMQPVASPS